jgi:undecaprenyl diphosphate synthase
MSKDFIKPSSFHVAIIMDGNGRWATSRGLPRIDGHRRGVKALEKTIEAAPSFEISDLTVYAFSSDNWRRPDVEVGALMSLFRQYLEREVEECAAKGVRLSFIGRRDRLAKALVQMIQHAEAKTASGRKLHLRVAIDYSSRDTLLQAARKIADGSDWSRERMAACLPSPNVDLLIRTAGEQRLSDFLLWESAYAEFVFLDVLWPDFGRADLHNAVDVYKARTRKFGALPAA